MRTSLFIVLSASLLVAGCGTHRTAVTAVPVETVVRDTVQLSSMRYDSIFVSNDVYTDRSRDTILMRERTIEHRYRVLRDTVRLVRRDSVPYEVRVTEYRDVPRRRSLFDYVAYAVLVLVAVWVLLRCSSHIF